QALRPASLVQPDLVHPDRCGGAGRAPPPGRGSARDRLLVHGPRLRVLGDRPGDRSGPGADRPSRRGGRRLVGPARPADARVARRGALILATRMVLNSTGRRPLITDLVVMGLFATAIAFTRVGWIGGVALAIGIYVD